MFREKCSPLLQTLETIFPQLSTLGLFPKDLHEWLNWIQQGKALYLDKKKIQTLIAQQRINLAEVDYLDLDSVEKIIHDFENFKKNPGKISEISQKNVLEPERKNPYLTMPIDIVRRHAETGVQLAKEALRKRTEEKQNKVGPEQSKEKKEEKTNVPTLTSSFVRRYMKQFGNVISSDNIKLMFRDDGYDPHDEESIRDFHKRTGPWVGRMFDIFLKTRKGKGDGTVVFTGGGNGSGKSSVLDEDFARNADFVMDSAMVNLSAARESIQKVIDNGQLPNLAFVYRDPREAWFNGVQKRNTMNADGHTVPKSTFANTHSKARENFLKLLEEFGSKVKYIIRDNSSDGETISLEELKAKPVYTKEQILEIINEETGSRLDGRREGRSYESSRRANGETVEGGSSPVQAVLDRGNEGGGSQRGAETTSERTSGSNSDQDAIKGRKGSLQESENQTGYVSRGLHPSRAAANGEEEDGGSQRGAETTSTGLSGETGESSEPVIEYVKKPSGVDFSEAKIYRDKGYRWTRVRMAEKDGDLYAEFGGSKEKAQYIKIANYADTTPADIIRNIPDQGRHFEDALHDFYAERNLQQGYVVDIFKKKTASPPNNNQEEHSRTPKATEQQEPEKEKSENAEKKLTLEKILDSDKDNAGKKLLLKRFAFDHKIPLKEAEEQMEFLVVQKARKIAHDSSISEDDAFQKILHLYEQMPLLNSRTSTSVMNQAYSTPVPLAYMLGRAIGIQNAKRVYEPTAGNGALLIAAKPESVSANEIEKIRNGILKTSGFKTVTSEDATTFSPEETQDAIIMNPPFGRLDRKVQFEKFKIAKLEHLIALQALKSLDKNGTAAIILGAADKLESKVNPTEKPFLNYIYDHFNIADSFEVAGDLYKKQGAGYPIRIIILNGRKENSDFSTEFSSKPVERLADWSNIFQRLKGVENGIDAWRKNHETELGQTGTERGNDVQHNALDHRRTAEDGKRSGTVSGKSDLADAQTVQKGERSGNDPRSAGESTRELPGTPVRGGRDSSGMAELDGLRNGSEVGIENSRGTSGLAGRSGESGGLRPVLADSGNSAVEDNNSETEPELSEDGLQAKYKTQSKSESLGTLKNVQKLQWRRTY